MNKMIEFLIEYIPIYAKQISPKTKLSKSDIEDIAYQIEEDIFDEINYNISEMLGCGEDD